MLTVTLHDPVALVPGLSLPQKYAAKRREYPHLPEPAQLVMEANTLSRNGGIPVSIDDRKKWLRLYAQRGCLGLRPTRHGDAYSIEFVEPMSLRNHGALARSRLRLTGPGWVYFGQLRDVPPGYHMPDAEIRSNWQRAQTADARPSPLPPSRYDKFCDALDLVIEGGRQIEAAKDPTERILPYYEVRSTGQLRRSAAGVYHFLLARPAAVQAGALVQLRDQSDLRGRVHSIDGERMTVTFDMAVDRRRIPERGELLITANEVVPRVQADAVASSAPGRHWPMILTVKGNQPTLHRQLAGLPWRAVPHATRDAGRGHGRREIRTGTGPQVMAALRNAAIGALRVTGATNIAAANRHHARDSTRPLALLGIV